MGDCKMKNYFRLLRPSQWIKNTFVFAPLVFSKHLFDVDWFFLSLRGFVAFCVVSSAVYIINDIFDRNADRAHPFKKNRPIASGAVTIPLAIVISVALLCIAGLLSFSLDLGFLLILLSYFVLQFFYSIALKRIAILDVFIIASGFMLRVLGGAMLINVLISHWIILCTMFLSLFVALAKRRGEIVLSEQSESPSQRKVLSQYDTPFLDGTMMITASGMAISYALYCRGPNGQRVWDRLSHLHDHIRPLWNFQVSFSCDEKEHGRKFCRYHPERCSYVRRPLPMVFFLRTDHLPLTLRKIPL